MITFEKLNAASDEIKRYSKCVKKYRERLNEDKMAKYGCKESGAVRRASMDVSRALTELRRS